MIVIEVSVVVSTMIGFVHRSSSGCRAECVNTPEH